MSKIPSNHKLAERILIKLVESGELKINENGEIWRYKKRFGTKSGGTKLIDVVPIRAERNLNGYLSIRGMFNNKRTTGFAHRLVWQYFNGNIENGLTINHKDGNKQNNHPTNLELATYSDQIKHCYHVLKNKSQVGEKNNQSKIKDIDIIKIIKLYDTKLYTQAEIAKIYGVCHQQISRIINGDRRNQDGNVKIKIDHRNCKYLERNEKGVFIGKRNNKHE